jgi:general stress protein 26
MSTHERTPEQAREHFWQLVTDARVAMFVTQRGGGGAMRLRSRPLTTQNGSAHRDDRLYFFVAADSEVAHEAQAEPSCVAAYADVDEDRYVSVTGRAHVLHDTELATRLWNAAAGAWFSGGAGDPNLRVLVLDIEEAEYWDVKSSKMVQLLKIAAANVTGRPPKMGEHEKLA